MPSCLILCTGDHTGRRRPLSFNKMRIPSRFAFRRNTQVSWAVQVFLTEACGHTLASLSPVMRSQ